MVPMTFDQPTIGLAADAEPAVVTKPELTGLVPDPEPTMPPYQMDEGLAGAVNATREPPDAKLSHENTNRKA